ncbi:hypothetical protein Cflav_PD2228 [Pedosphaera parvula Ellin514]|uniref:Uncharacterized protein n=2 Tax=Pedosphaera TaxID=1032526 RepID=B9XL33_PEDPL|nr:hypothetical protein Cflav_PD2228 [Pedosphaera parvula Ellin514]
MVMPFIVERSFANPTRRMLLTSLVLCSGLFCGCVQVLRPYNQASQQKFRVKSAMPLHYTISVANESEYRVAADGRVIVDVPQLQRGCDTYLFDIVKISDGSPYNLRVIQLKSNNHVVRKLSLNDVAKLPVDEKGYHLLTVE